MNKNIWGHFLALLVVFIWGITFISTKVLIQNGLTPFEIMLYRFVGAYAALCIICPRFVKLNTKKDELCCMIAGLFGVVLYFLAENTALLYTQVSNVGVFVTIAPIFTILLMRVSTKSFKLRRNYFVGSAIAIIGTAFVMLNGAALSISPFGDILALFAALCWGVYSICLNALSENNNYNMIVITRKMFFYSILFFIPCGFLFGVNPDLDVLLNSNVFINLLFLSIIASGLGYVIWNYALSIIGVVVGTLYVYCIPVVTIVAAAIILGEKMTPFTLAGSGMILVGVYISEGRTNNGS